MTYTCDACGEDHGHLRHADPAVGDMFTAWGRTWRVSRVWDDVGVAEITDIDNDQRTARRPFTQFYEFVEVK